MGRWLLCLMLLWPVFASAEEQWKANIREGCIDEWPNDIARQNACITEHDRFRTRFIHEYSYATKDTSQAYQRCWEISTETNSTNWSKVKSCIEANGFDWDLDVGM